MYVGTYQLSNIALVFCFFLLLALHCGVFSSVGTDFGGKWKMKVRVCTILWCSS